jgi:hypothetical protein
MPCVIWRASVSSLDLIILDQIVPCTSSIHSFGANENPPLATAMAQSRHAQCADECPVELNIRLLDGKVGARAVPAALAAASNALFFVMLPISDNSESAPVP